MIEKGSYVKFRRFFYCNGMFWSRFKAPYVGQTGFVADITKHGNVLLLFEDTRRFYVPLKVCKEVI